MLGRMLQGLDAIAIAVVVVAFLSDGRVDLLLARPLGAGVPFVAAGFAAAWLLKAAGVYAFSRGETLAAHLARTAGAIIASGVFAIALARFAAPQMQATAWRFAGAALLSMSALHLLDWIMVRRWRRQGRLTPNIVVVGATENAARLIEAALDSGEVAVLGVFDDRSDRAPTAVHGVPVLGDTRRLLEHHILPYVDRIVITVTGAGQMRVRELMERLRVLPNAVTLFLDTDGAGGQAAMLSRLQGASLAGAGVHADAQRALAKRAQDIVLTALALLVLWPVLLAIAVAIRLDSPGPILFRQRRHGFNNEVITVWKFRSMRQEAADATAARQVSAGDDRITRVGRFIRRTSLDELPQLFNIGRGEMSLVGPRPHAIGMKTAGEDSARLVAEYAWRHRMKPGLTGWAQINGSRGPVDTAEAVRRRVELDIDYIERQSFWLDLYIIAATLPCLLGDRDAVR